MPWKSYTLTPGRLRTVLSRCKDTLHCNNCDRRFEVGDVVWHNERRGGSRDRDGGWLHYVSTSRRCETCYERMWR